MLGLFQWHFHMISPHVAAALTPPPTPGPPPTPPLLVSVAEIAAAVLRNCFIWLWGFFFFVWTCEGLDVVIGDGYLCSSISTWCFDCGYAYGHPAPGGGGGLDWVTVGQGRRGVEEWLKGDGCCCYLNLWVYIMQSHLMLLDCFFSVRVRTRKQFLFLHQKRNGRSRGLIRCLFHGLHCSI